MKRRTFAAWAALAMGLLVAPRSFAQGRSGEWRIKAAFLYKFGGYVEWPAQAFERADSPIVIGVVGADALAEELMQVASGRTINGRSVMVHRLRRSDSLAGAHVVFVAQQESSRMADILASAKGQAVLTVTEADDAPPPPGSMINFVVVDDKVRFDIALQTAEQNNLKISARLLAVARRVIAKPS